MLGHFGRKLCNRTQHGWVSYALQKRHSDSVSVLFGKQLTNLSKETITLSVKPGGATSTFCAALDIIILEKTLVYFNCRRQCIPIHPTRPPPAIPFFHDKGWQLWLRSHNCSYEYPSLPRWLKIKPVLQYPLDPLYVFGAWHITFSFFIVMYAEIAFTKWGWEFFFYSPHLS